MLKRLSTPAPQHEAASQMRLVSLALLGRLTLVMLLLATPTFAQDDEASQKRRATLALIKATRAKMTGPEIVELDYRTALVLEEEATSLEAKGKRELAEPFRVESQALLKRIARDSPAFRPDEVKARLRTPAPIPSGPDDALRVARVDFDAELARAPLPALPPGHDIALECCVLTGMLGGPVGVVIKLTLPAVPDAPGAERPTTSLGGYSVAASGEAKILRRPDFAQVRNTAPQTAAAARRAVELAHAKLATLEVWAPYRARGGGYSTSLVAATGQTWNVYFRAPNDSFTVNVDLERNKVTRITVGAAATAVPLEK